MVHLRFQFSRTQHTTSISQQYIGPVSVLHLKKRATVAKRVSGSDLALLQTVAGVLGGKTQALDPETMTQLSAGAKGTVCFLDPIAMSDPRLPPEVSEYIARAPGLQPASTLRPFSFLDAYNPLARKMDG